MENNAENHISVIICAYTDERWTDLVRSVDAAAHDLSPHDQLILVIDHNDQLLTRARNKLRASGRPELLVVPSTEVRGLSGARNTGIRYATGEIVAFIDDDAAIEPGWREALMRRLS